MNFKKMDEAIHESVMGLLKLSVDGKPIFEDIRYDISKGELSAKFNGLLVKQYLENENYDKK